jgi:hypothetical protein
MRIDVHEHQLAQALINSGRLSAEETMRHTLVQRELEHLISDFSLRWARETRDA